MSTDIQEQETAVQEPAEPVQPAEPLSPEDRIRAIASALLNHTITTNPRLHMALSAMIVARQLYVVGYRDLERRLAMTTEKQRREQALASMAKLKSDVAGLPEGMTEPTEEEIQTAWEMLEAYFVDVAAHRAGQPFNETTFGQNIAHCQKWFDVVLPEHQQWEKADQLQAISEWDKVRREKTVPMPFNESYSALDRGKSLVLFGWRPAVMWLLDFLTTYLTEELKEDVNIVIRLSSSANKVEPNPRLARLGKKAWADCCKTGASFPALFGAMILPQLGDPPDVLVVDDLAHAANTVGLIGGSPARKAGNAHKRFREWSNKIGCGIVAGVLFDEQGLPEVAGSDWEQLRLFTQLRAVSVAVDPENPDEYSIYLGQVFVANVSKATLDSYGGSGLITPKLEIS